MRKGGYQIIDLKGEALTSGTAKTIKGTYAQATGAKGKRTVISGLKIGSGNVLPDFESPFTYSTNTATTTLSGGTLAIGSTDSVTYTAN